MPAPLPTALRDRFARLIEDGFSVREASRRLQVSAATGGHWAQQIRARGAATVAPMGRPSDTGKLNAHVGFFLELVKQDPDITLFELRNALANATGVAVHHSAIATLLKRLGFTHKKVAGGHRMKVRKGKATTRRLEPPSCTSHRPYAGSCCIH